jgi:hypothetical protein
MDSRKATRFAASCCVAAAAALTVPASAQGATPDKYLELLRSDVRTSKVEILTEALNLTEAQGAAFWPLYREYDAELAALGDRRISMVKRFVEKYGTMSNEDAGVFAKDWFALQQDRLKLREKYFGKISKATDNLIAARFVQVENVIGMLIDIQIAAESPLMK